MVPNEGRVTPRKVLPAVVAALLLLLALSPLVAIFGVWRWNGATEGAVARLRDLPSPPVAPALSPVAADGEIDSLPPPVARYLRAVLPPAVRPVSKARLRWRGHFLVRPGEEGWRPFEAEQVCRTAPAGFVWSAHVTVFPGIRVLVRDSFVGGEGAVGAALLGLVPLADMHGTPEVAAASLQRHLAESVWFPTALLPRHGVRWEPIDGASARATLSSGGTTVSLDFRFGPDGLAESVHAPGRFRDVDGKAVATPWEGRFRDYALRDGLKVPSSGEAAWLLPGGRLPYWRGTLADAAFERET